MVRTRQLLKLLLIRIQLPIMLSQNLLLADLRCLPKVRPQYASCCQQLDMGRNGRMFGSLNLHGGNCWLPASSIPSQGTCSYCINGVQLEALAQMACSALARIQNEDILYVEIAGLLLLARCQSCRDMLLPTTTGAGACLRSCRSSPLARFSCYP